MKDAVGRMGSVLVLGGTSDLGAAIVRALARDGTRRVVLAGRDEERLRATAATLPGVRVDTVPFDAEDTDSHERAVAEAFADGDIDVAVVAFGVLGDPANDERDPRAATHVARVNYVGSVSAGVALANRMREQGHGTIVALSSVAGERARRANFIYGSAKAGMDAFFQGLGDALVGSGVHVMVVRPGFVPTKMTAARARQPFATTPDAVARAVVDGLRSGAEIVWAPGFLRWVFAIIRHLPRPVFRRLPS